MSGNYFKAGVRSGGVWGPLESVPTTEELLAIIALVDPNQKDGAEPGFDTTAAGGNLPRMREVYGLWLEMDRPDRKELLEGLGEHRSSTEPVDQVPEDDSGLVNPAPPSPLPDRSLEVPAPAPSASDNQQSHPAKVSVPGPSVSQPPAAHTCLLPPRNHPISKTFITQLRLP